jgi:hypothetical protein
MPVQAQVIGLEQVQQAMRDAPDLAFRYCKQELRKSGARFKRRFVAERLSGRPGINWPGAKAAGGGMKAYTSGTDLGSLRFSARLSRWLTKHETGGTITPTKGQYLIITANTAGGGGDLLNDENYTPRKIYHSAKRSFVILRRVRSVRITARLGFKTLFNSMTQTDFVPHLKEAMDRAMKEAFAQKARSVLNMITKAA